MKREIFTWIEYYRRLCGTAKAHGVGLHDLKSMAIALYGRPLDRLTAAELQGLAYILCKEATDVDGAEQKQQR